MNGQKVILYALAIVQVVIWSTVPMGCPVIVASLFSGAYILAAGIVGMMA